MLCAMCPIALRTGESFNADMKRCSAVGTEEILVYRVSRRPDLQRKDVVPSSTSVEAPLK